MPIDSDKLPEAIRQIIGRLDQAGFETWLVGGCVRDLCLGLIPKDFDLATNARPEQVQAIFTRNFTAGLQHGTVTVLWQDLAVEITTFRSEGAYTDSRRPDLVFFQNEVEADLARRDFTMNSLAWRPDRGLLDLHEGLPDLQQGLLRTVGDAKQRFNEDVLRVLRAVRFAVTYDLTPDPDLVRAAAEHAGRLSILSRERIVGEMMRILTAPYPHQLESFGGCGIMAGTARILFGVRTDDRTLCANLSRLIMTGLPAAMRLPLFFLGAAAPDFEPDRLRSVLGQYLLPGSSHSLLQMFMRECRISRKLAQDGEAILYLFYLRLLLPLDRTLPLQAQRRILRLLARRAHLAKADAAARGEQTSQLLQLCLGPVPSAAPELAYCFWNESWQEVPLTVSELALDGRQLHLAGWTSGPAMRRLLERLLSKVIVDPALNQPADLMALAWRWDEPGPGRAAK